MGIFGVWRRTVGVVAVVAAVASCGPSGGEGGTSCDPSTCFTPPPALCNGDNRVTFSPFGECGATACVYPPTETPCEFGCAEGACNPPPGPCDGVTCSAPPEAACDGNTAITYTLPGTCEDGECTYGTVTENCSSGGLFCRGGICVAAGLLCDDGTRNGRETDVDCGGSCEPCRDDLLCGAAADCISGVCTSGRCVAAACRDRIENGDETDVDCGGSCSGCDDGEGCAVDADCESQRCGDDGTCAASTCTDTVQNGAEAGVDCGGGCPGCAPGAACGANADCSSRICRGGTCAAPTCSDLVANGTETDVDCGGECGGCATGAICDVGGDCLTGVCSGASRCAAPSCTDRAQNGTETGVDCGGSCAGCAAGIACEVSSDCISGVCGDDGVCAEPSCDDGIRNGDERGVDCAGSCPAACGTGASCASPADCLSGVCAGAGVCLAPSCTDDLRNGSETDVDCGGSCGRCDIGEGCLLATDCVTARCYEGFCAPTGVCTNGRRDGLETDIDCGGPDCSSCAAGRDCAEDSDCFTGNCTDELQCGGWLHCGDGVTNEDETDIDCGGFRCSRCEIGAACESGEDCATNVCGDGDVCVEASCFDGVVNQDEIFADCGGVCGTCVLECEDFILSYDLNTFAVDSSSWRHTGTGDDRPVLDATAPGNFFTRDFECTEALDGTFGPDAAYRFEAPSTGIYRFSTEPLSPAGTDVDTVIYAIDSWCTVAGEEIACNDDGTPSVDWSTLEIELTAGDVVFVIVDTATGVSGTYELAARLLAD